MLPTELITAAKVSYRNVLRAGSTTFAGDARMLQAWRQKAREEFIAGRSITEPKQFQARLDLANEVATVLRANVAQGEYNPKDDRWAVRVTKHTELGDNESIKNPPAMEKVIECEGSKARRRKAQAEAGLAPSTLFNEGDLVENEPPDFDVDGIEDVVASTTLNPTDEPSRKAKKKLNLATLKKVSKQRVLPELREEDLEEMFIRGSGPGGQATNKTSNNVSLIHKPTGIRVACHATRSQATNRRIARRMLLEKLDELQNPGLTTTDVKRAKLQERKRQRAKKARKKQRSTAEAAPDDDAV